ncbi:hypothetical protein F2Q68_00046637 [Brassica cretica]|uniref:Uncharacterized protein n=1 Tax=Brassica cretica TaxID=69181 RepID=A0A8S9LQ68_BRACR|nr:hypothetical protein F2Q68_00046637 [Brassica cretica]
MFQNQIGMGQRIGQGNGVEHPTMSYFHEFPNHLQEIQQVSSDAFGSLFPQHFHCFSDDNLPVITTNITATSLNRQQHCLCAHTLSTREPLLSNQNHNYYDLNQFLAVNTEHSSHIDPSNLIPNGLHNYMPYQTYVPIISAFTINGQQLPPSVLAIRRNEAHNLRTVNNSARYKYLCMYLLSWHIQCNQRVRPKRSQARGSRYIESLPAPATRFHAGAGLSRRRCLLPSSHCSLLTSNFRCYGVVAFCKPKKGIPDGAFVGDMSFGSSFPL